MSELLTLTLYEEPDEPVDLSPLIPEELQGKTAKQIAAIPLKSGEGEFNAGDLFEIAGKGGGHIEIRRSCDRLEHIGRGMTQGSITVKGTVGAFLGQSLRGGVITVKGDAGPWAGSGMRGGCIEILGNAGDSLGAVYLGEQYGMRGGLILVMGNAGDRVGERMRRGTIVIQGDAGEYLGTNMLAGTIMVLGRAGRYTGFGMKRGTILLMAKPTNMPSTFNNCGTFDLGFLRLLFSQLSGISRRFRPMKELPSTAERFAGDLGSGGKGEILILQPV